MTSLLLQDPLLLILDDYRPIEDNPKMRAVADRICVAAAGAVRHYLARERSDTSRADHWAGERGEA